MQGIKADHCPTVFPYPQRHHSPLRRSHITSHRKCVSPPPRRRRFSVIYVCQCMCDQRSTLHPGPVDECCFILVCVDNGVSMSSLLCNITHLRTLVEWSGLHIIADLKIEPVAWAAQWVVFLVLLGYHAWWDNTLLLQTGVSVDRSVFTNLFLVL